MRPKDQNVPDKADLGKAPLAKEIDEWHRLNQASGDRHAEATQ